MCNLRKVDAKLSSIDKGRDFNDYANEWFQLQYSNNGYKNN